MDRLNVEEPGFLRSIIGSKQFTLNIFNLNMDDLEVMINEYIMYNKCIIRNSWKSP